MLKRGIKTLSQKQRLANACALYRDPQVLIFDEATSSLDSIYEELVQQTIHKFMKQGRTIILIIYRLGTVLQADKIVVLEKGKLMEEGPHNSLYAQKVKYYQMWQRQLPEITVQ